MTARSLAEVLHGFEPAKVRRTFQPVRRNSYDLNDRRAQELWRPLGSKQNARKLIALRLKAAEDYNERNKGPGDRQGPLGDIGLRLLRELYRIVDFETGRLDPAIDTLCERIKRARATVVKYLAKLKQHGFLQWVRRCEPTNNEGDAGPQVRQMSNAYGLRQPASAEAWVEKMANPGPIPDCEVFRRREAEVERKSIEDGLSLREFVNAVVEDRQINDILAKMADRLSNNSASSLSGQNPDPSIFNEKIGAERPQPSGSRAAFGSKPE